MKPANPYLAARTTQNGTPVTGLALSACARYLTGALLLAGPHGTRREPCRWLAADGKHRGQPTLALVLPAEPETPTT